MKYKQAIDRQGKFGKLFIDYKGCPAGMFGAIGYKSDEEIDRKKLLLRALKLMPPIEDINGNVWVPVLKSVLDDIVEILNT